jgi:starch synthase (maltosyl-transferring)
MGFDHVACAPLFAPAASGDIFLTRDHESVHPALNEGGAADAAIGRLCSLCDELQLNLILTIVLDRVAADSELAKKAHDRFRSHASDSTAIDPRSRPIDTGAAFARFDDAAPAKELTDWWSERLLRLARSGVAGFLCDHPDRVPAAIWRALIGNLRRTAPQCSLLAWTPGMPWSRVSQLRGLGFDAAFSSLPWWDSRASWFVHEYELLRQVGAVIACPEAPFGTRLARRIGAPSQLRTAYRHALDVAASTGDCILVPMGFEFASAIDMDRRHSDPRDFAAARATRRLDLSEDIRTVNGQVEEIGRLELAGEMRALTSPGSRVTAILRCDAADARRARKAMVVLINSDFANEHPVPIMLDPLPPPAGAAFEPASGGTESNSPLGPGEVRFVHLQRGSQIKQQRAGTSVQKWTTAPRMVIDNIGPSVDGGRFAVKTTIGESITVEADVFMDGHDVLAVELLWRPADETDWQRGKMQHLGNDRWRASITPARIGRYTFTIEAWRDEYETFCRDIEIKHKAGTEISLEIEEGRRLLEHARERCQETARGALDAALAALADAATDRAVEILSAGEVREAMAACDPRDFLYQHAPALPADVERPQACFGTWYELFPRSATDDPNRHGTFADVIRRLPAIRDMGFDTLYLPPIHPIGTTNRKGRNNALRAEPADLGSPYAIGSQEGGHDAIHPALGTIEDFRRLREAAAQNGLEIALDFAIQCSPDHPWLKQHHGWFRWRPDGSVRFAENPPKKYEDIVTVDFYAGEAVPELWIALRDIVLYWVKEGVLVFRVDNPHTKPLPFWEWLIADVRGRHPDVIFLSEAFTRPKMMHRLAKVGFSQSYTYFTWRNGKRELTDYLTELTTSGVREYFRPHFFVNTPDINPTFLQTSGRAGFLIRAALAATLSGLWGMYSGFELCESAPLPGREEYLDSEKYQIRVRDYAAPGNIVAEITKLNLIRKANPALQTHLGLRFYNAFNDNIIYYGKSLPGRDDMILVAVNFDPHQVQEATIEVPLWEWGLPDFGSVLVEDLMKDTSFVWSGKLQRIRLDPRDLPFAVWRIAPAAGG